MKKRRGLLYAAIVLLFGAAVIEACVHQPAQTTAVANDGGYPPEIAKIFVAKCATAGCHNSLSYQNAGGLEMDTWDHLFNGSSGGASVVPYNIENSPLLYFINTDSTEGPVLTPTMPLYQPALTKTEYETVKSWIANGAPDKNGNIPFATNSDTRQKIYIAEQGCDLIAVIDAERQVVMRQIAVGKTSAIESPHCVRFSPDGKYAYVGFLAGNYIQKINTSTDAIEAECYVDNGQWNILHVSDDGTELIAADFVGGVLKIIKTSDMTLAQTINGGGLFVDPHGIAACPTFDTFFVTAQYGNVVYKLSRDGNYFEKLSIDGNAPVEQQGIRDPHEILMTPDHSKYFLTCQASNEVRVLDAHTNAVLKVFHVGIYPQELALSKTQPYMFVTCQEDVSSFAHYKGSVYVLNYNTLEVVQRIDGPFYQPHGIAVDDQRGQFYVASANVDTGGIAPHHVSNCAGRNGYYNVYDLNTLQPANTKRFEVTVYPYSADTRFK